MGQKFKKIIKDIFQGIIEIIYPIEDKCIICNEDECYGICNTCLNKIKTIPLKYQGDIISYGYYGGILKELICLLVSFNFIRFFAFGMHASKSSICLIFSSLLFIIFSILCKYIVLPKYLLYILYLLAIAIISIYAPADTVKRPLIKRKKRIKFKILSIMVVIIYFILTLVFKNNLLINSLIFGLLTECILINPITYKAFKMPYKNYITYGLNA